MTQISHTAGQSSGFNSMVIGAITVVTIVLAGLLSLAPFVAV